MPSQYYSPALHVDPFTGWQYVVHTPTTPMFTPMAVPENTPPVSVPESNVPVAGHENTLPASLVDQIEYYFRYRSWLLVWFMPLFFQFVEK